MSDQDPADELDPSEVTPTDNSTGVPVDPERLSDLEREQPSE